jgi:MOSC domain-containing protein YiiM
MNATVIAVACDSEYQFSKQTQNSIRLLEGLGIEGDAHSGKTVKHRHLVKKNPATPNLRQVHLIHEELFDELRIQGFDLQAGDIGENVLTRGIDLLGLPKGTRLTIGKAVIEVTGLRNPCYQLDKFKKGLMKACIDNDADGKIVFKSGIMSIVIASGVIKPGDVISIELPDKPHQTLKIV